MIHYGLSRIAACAFAASFGACAAAEAGEVRSVVELFTSQGCSSCPPADRLLQTLAREKDVLALSFPVDYWDYIGWRDTLASPRFTARQKGYAATRGDGQVYTPQAVIDGLSHAVGSERGEIETAARKNHGRDGALTVGLSTSEANGRLRIAVGAAPAGAPRAAGLWLIRYARSRNVAIGRGENTGRSMIYTNVVRAMVKLGDWAGAPAVFEASTAQLRAEDSDGYAIVLQAGSEARPGVILAAQSD